MLWKHRVEVATEGIGVPQAEQALGDRRPRDRSGRRCRIVKTASSTVSMIAPRSLSAAPSWALVSVGTPPDGPISAPPGRRCPTRSRVTPLIVGVDTRARRSHNDQPVGPPVFGRHRGSGGSEGGDRSWNCRRTRARRRAAPGTPPRRGPRDDGFRPRDQTKPTTTTSPAMIAPMMLTTEFTWCTPRPEHRRSRRSTPPRESPRARCKAGTFASPSC